MINNYLPFFVNVEDQVSEFEQSIYMKFKFKAYQQMFPDKEQQQFIQYLTKTVV